jgi:hypothetical protein
VNYLNISKLTYLLNCSDQRNSDPKVLEEWKIEHQLYLALERENPNEKANIYWINEINDNGNGFLFIID